MIIIIIAIIVGNIRINLVDIKSNPTIITMELILEIIIITIIDKMRITHNQKIKMAPNQRRRSKLNSQSKLTNRGTHNQKLNISNLIKR